MRISTVSILGEGELKEELQRILSKAEPKVIIYDTTQDYSEQVLNADLVLETENEDFAVKKKIFENCDNKFNKKTILATTSGNPWITRLAATTKRPDKVIGLNFTKNPFEEKYLVQIVKGLQTSDDTVQYVSEFLVKMGIAIARLVETPGFILDRVIASIINEATIMYSSNLADIKDIDKMMKVCVNWPMGPFEFADAIGIDRVVDILESLSQQLGPKYVPSFTLRKMVDAGWLGKKTGRGFYVYNLQPK